MTVEEWLGKDNQLGIDIWHKKYQYNNETFEEWLDRVSGGNQNIRRLIAEKKFLFGGRTLSNRGTNKKGSYSNCYTRGRIHDDLKDILQANTDIGLTYKLQGGQGLSLSEIRPKGCGINGGQYKSDGIISFMELYNKTTESISQGGSRKGALIMTLDIWHKEAEEFIKIKSEKGRIQKSNLSLEIDDEFMKCVEKYYTTGEEVKKHIVKYYSGNKVEYDVVPIYLYKLMMSNAYDWGEPGCIYTNNFFNYNMMEYDNDYKIEAPNPCGEQPLPKHGACNLGSINLSEFVINPFTEDAFFDVEDFIKSVKYAIEGLDEVVSENINNHPLYEQKKMAENYRNVGLGIMGLHDMLIKLNLIYGSEESITFIDSLMDLMFRTAVIHSSILARKKGTFPKYSNKLLSSKIIRRHFSKAELDILEITKYGLRNCSLLSIAPSGSIATMLNISTGCEPIFGISYKRKTESLNNNDKYYDVYINLVKEYIDKYGTNKLPDTFITAKDIEWKSRIEIQAALQKHVDTSISSTVNLRNDISLDEIEQLYLYAWKKGLKGVTIFRYGSKREGILTTENIKEEHNSSDSNKVIYNYITPIARNEISDKPLPGRSYAKKTACGKMYIHINHEEVGNNIVEVFVDSAKSGGCAANARCLGSYASAALRSGMKVESVIDVTQGIKCSACIGAKGKGMDIDGISCGDVIAKTIKEEYMLLNKDKKTENNIKKNGNKNTCPECGSEVAFEGGCITCKNCGWSKCE